MSAKITINSITWNATPAGNQTGTVRYRPWGSTGAWTVVTAGQVIHPDGVLAPVAVITGLDEGTDYEVEVKNNTTGGTVTSGRKKISTASVNDTLTFYNKMETGTITSIKIDGGANILSSPLAAGANFPYSAPALYGNSHLVEVILGLSANTRVYSIIKDSEVDSAGQYHTAISGTQFSVWNTVIPAGKNFYIRNANYHMKAAQYTFSHGGLHGACSIGSPEGFVERTTSAINDSDTYSETATVHITWTPDSEDAGPISANYVLSPGVASVVVPSLEISVNPCTAVVGAISSISIS